MHLDGTVQAGEPGSLVNKFSYSSRGGKSEDAADLSSIYADAGCRKRFEILVAGAQELVEGAESRVVPSSFDASNRWLGNARTGRKRPLGQPGPSASQTEDYSWIHQAYDSEYTIKCK
jgi:hypothetical protein